MEQAGFDKKVFINKIESSFNKNAKINTEKFIDYIFDNIKPYVNDSHFSIYIAGQNKNFGRHEIIYLSDTYVKKIKAGYKVIKSGKISSGTVLDLSEENLFKTIIDGKEVYRVGVLAPDGKYGNVTNLSVFVNNEKINLQCVYSPEYFLSNEFQVKESKNSVYIKIPIFERNTDHYEQFKDFGKKYKNKKNIIIDLRQNPGGDNQYMTVFLYDLFYEEEDYSVFDEICNLKHKKEMMSLLIEQQKIINEEVDDEFEKPEKENKNEKKFNGNLIFLTSKNSASCSELMIIISKQLFDKVFVIGTNTNGAVAFANPFQYLHKNSGIIFRVGQLQIENYGIEEGTGIMPDYVVSGNLEETIKYLTKDKKIAKEISVINK